MEGDVVAALGLSPIWICVQLLLAGQRWANIGGSLFFLSSRNQTTNKHGLYWIMGGHFIQDPFLSYIQ